MAARCPAAPRAAGDLCPPGATRFPVVLGSGMDIADEGPARRRAGILTGPRAGPDRAQDGSGRLSGGPCAPPRRRGPCPLPVPWTMGAEAASPPPVPDRAAASTAWFSETFMARSAARTVTSRRSFLSRVDAENGAPVSPDWSGRCTR